jgi:hypothetical protein
MFHWGVGHRSGGWGTSALELPGQRDGLLLVESGSGGERVLEAIRPQRRAYLSSQLVLASPQHRP